jgi:hypothetical protein
MDATVVQGILDDIDALIAAKLSGSTDLSQLADRNLGNRTISLSSTLRELRELRDYYARILAVEQMDGREDVFVVET